MKTIKVESTDPYYNLALEEYLFKLYPLEEDLFYVWQNTSSVIIGRNQDPNIECDLDFLKEHSIPLIRRNSGGGTVYHDMGNINFTYITNNYQKVKQYDFFLNPIIKVLNQVGVKAHFVPPSHIYIGEHKISGNAQSIHKNKILHHGTLLFDVNKENLINIINKNVEENKITTVRSNVVDVLNIKDVLNIEASAFEFKEFIQKELLFNDVKYIELNERDYEVINKLMSQKYLNEEWNYQHKTSSE
jgi:lipoate-protein ligase A